MERIKVGILGGSGYAGAELTKILLLHPQAEIVLVTSNQKAGKRVDSQHPNLRGLTDLVFSPTTVSRRVHELDCLFLCLPHGHSLSLVPQLPRPLRVIDLAGDFRLSDPKLFQRFYKKDPADPTIQRDFIYGLPELFRDKIAKARRVANPGCFATASALGLAPLVRRDLIKERVIIDAKTGSSGSGVKPGPNTHHPFRNTSFFPYKCFGHQHLPEIEQALRTLRPEWTGGLILQTHSTPLVRGILVSIYAELNSALSTEDLGEVFRQSYDEACFVRLLDAPPNVTWVKNTNFVDLGWAQSGRQLIVFAAIDNLVKGAAGQAVQNFNLMFGLAEQTGLILAGGNP